MSKATKRKHVFNELLNDEIRAPKETEVLCRTTASRGNNLHEVETSDGDVFLASMPTKFRRNVWVKRGDFVLVERIDEGTKVKGEIVIVLTRDHVKYYRSQGVWPDRFDSDSRGSPEDATDEPICNRGNVCESDSETDSDDSSENESCR